MSSSVARCYTPLKTNICINKPKDQYENRRDSFEIDVFQASSYYSAIGGEGNVSTDDASNAEDVIVNRSRHSIDLVAPCKELEKKKKKSKKEKKHNQPGSPGAKLASYLSSLLNQTLQVSPKPKKNKPVLLFEDDKWSSRTISSMSLTRCSDVGEATSVHSCPTYTRRPTPIPACTMGLRSYSSVSSKQSLLGAETLVGDGRWPALTWFDKELEIRKGLSYSSVKGLKKVREEDGGESDSSSDLFELRNHDLRGHVRSGDQFPVHRTTNMNNIKARR